jgi:two-component system sensor histidine kinase YesM
LNEELEPLLFNKLVSKPSRYFMENKMYDNPTLNQGFQFEGQSYLSTIITTPYDKWRVVQVIAVNELTQGTDAIKLWTISTILVSLFIAFILAVIISKNITGNVRLLLQSMTNFSVDFTHKVIVPTSRDEVGLLAEKFNSMAEKIGELINTIYKEKLLKQKAEYRTLQFEYKALQAQINPHFLYNTLSFIDSIATVKQEKEISAITQMLADIFRYSTNGNDVATIDDEVGQLQRYLHIQKTRYGEDLRWQFIIDPNVRECKIVKLLLQPLVENSVIHGIRKAGTIKVIILPNGDNLSIAVEDNGAGMAEEELTALTERLETSSNRLRSKTDGGSHIGLANVCHRIKSFYGETYGLAIVSSEGLGTKVTITIPIVRETSQNDNIA